VFVRLNQTGTTNYVVMEVTKPEGSVFTSVGHNPYYQWGRKDALHPSNGTNSNTVLSPLYGKTTTLLFTDDKQPLERTIKNPDRHYGNKSHTPYDWCSTTYNGWWCAGNTETGADQVTVKTIYDPSPAGYTIPRCNAFLGFRLGTSGESPNANGDFTNGYYFWNGYRTSSSDSTDEMKTIFFPAAGGRNSKSTLNNVTLNGNYWSAVPNNNNSGHYLFFKSGSVSPQGNNNRTNAYPVRPSQEE
jgi:hypothetical protein